MNNKTTKDVVMDVIKERKSVRSFVTGKHVPDADLELLVRAGMAAPTSKNSRPWFFIAINNRGVIASLAKSTPSAEMLQDAGSAIVVLGEPRRSIKEVPDVWVQDLSAASENILLLAEAMGLGGCWCQLYPYEDRINELRAALKIPEQIVPFNIICIGYPTGYDVAQDKWEPKRLFWNKWDSRI